MILNNSSTPSAVPPPKIYTLVSPFKVDIDLMSCLWLNAFACHLKERTLQSTPASPYIDVHLEVLMPRVCISLIFVYQRWGIRSM